MRREGRQHGWVFAVDRSLVDPEGKKSRARTMQVEGAAAATNGGGFVRVPRKPTNHSKPGVGHAYRGLVGKGEAGSGRGRRKFKHDEAKMYHLEVQGAEDAAADAYDLDA
ncbi:hypothetical protein GQ55_5G176800 [Panicum hallii var. hallii]|uniref:Uncharacterized protein n=1 Tax=Panicum hallii var. hallii TaxID=1504633 RepID=A0A2T7DHF8_9POAL|nr:hypothetical protein GQ55_5G176800 [Panicum hallii var. hallii]